MIEKIIKLAEDNGYYIVYNNNISKKDIKYMWVMKRHILSILKYTEDRNLYEINKRIQKNKTFGSVTSLEKYSNLYGKEEGTRRFNNKKDGAITLKNQILKYGKEEGTRRFNSYREKQAYSNTKEYKMKKHGWSSEDFEKYNKSRAVTLKNQILKYGKEEGTRRFDLYCKRQAYTNTKEYLKEKYEKVCKMKSHTLENYIRLYGSEEIAKQKLVKFYSNTSFYSKISQDLFWFIYNNLLNDEEKIKTYFAELNKEYCLFSKDGIKMYDFVCSKLNLCIEFHGDHYHGNPKIYAPNDFMKGKGQTRIKAKQKWLLDDIRKEEIEKNRGYEYIVVWELDYRNNKDDVLSRIREKIDDKRNRKN